MKKRQHKKLTTKQLFVKLFTLLSRFGHFIDLGLVSLIAYELKQEGEKYYLIFVGLALYFAYRAIKLEYKVYLSKQIILSDSVNSRVIGFEGGQGRGKSSLMVYSASVINEELYSNVPIKINGKLSNMLTLDHIDLREQLTQHSTIIFDEITLFYHNLDKINCYSFELFLQLIRHFTDGCVMFASVSMGRIPKQLEEKVSLFKRLLGQRYVYNSFITTPIIKFISWVFKLNVPTGMRVWTYQSFETIDHANYNFDLSNQEADTDLTRFANLVEIYAFNSATKFEYIDRFFYNIYSRLPEPKPVPYAVLQFDYSVLHQTGFGKVVDYFEAIINGIDNKPNDFNSN